MQNTSSTHTRNKLNTKDTTTMSITRTPARRSNDEGQDLTAEQLRRLERAVPDFLPFDEDELEDMAAEAQRVGEDFAEDDGADWNDVNAVEYADEVQDAQDDAATAAPSAELVDDETPVHQLFHATNPDTIDTTMTAEEDRLAQEMAALGAQLPESLDAVDWASAVTGTPKQATAVALHGEVLDAVPGVQATGADMKAVNEAAKALEKIAAGAWGRVSPQVLDLTPERVLQASVYERSPIGFYERFEEYFGGVLKFRPNGEPAIYTGTHYRTNGDLDAALVSMVVPVMRSITAVETKLAVTNDPDCTELREQIKLLEQAGNDDEATKKRAELKKAEKRAVADVVAFNKLMTGKSLPYVVKELKYFMAPRNQVNEEQWASAGLKVNFLDGTFDLKTKTLGPHCQEDYQTSIIGLRFADVEGAQNDDVDKMFARLERPEQPGASKLFRRFLGTGLTTSVKHKAFVYLWGPRDSGKSTMAEYAVAATRPPAEYAEDTLMTQGDPNAFIKMKEDSSKSHARHELRGRRFVWFDEVQGMKFDDKLLNTITSPMGKVSSQPLYATAKDRSLWKPTQSLVFVGNAADAVPRQEGSQARFIPIKAGDGMARTEADLSEERTELVDKGFLERLNTYEARCAMVWQMILGAQEMLDGGMGDEALVGDCGDWIQGARDDLRGGEGDPLTVWLENVAVVLDEEPADHEHCYTPVQIAAEVNALGTGYMGLDGHWRKYTASLVSTELEAIGYKTRQPADVGSRRTVVKLGRPRLKDVAPELQAVAGLHALGDRDRPSYLVPVAKVVTEAAARRAEHTERTEW